jgi:hypothetical protein
MKSVTIPRNQRFHDATIMCPRCKTEPVHYLRAFGRDGVWTGAPPARVDKRNAEKIAVKVGFAPGAPHGRRLDGLMPFSEISGEDQRVRVACDCCKGEHQVKLETLRREAHKAWKNQWDRLTFNDGGTLVKYDDTWLR